MSWWTDFTQNFGSGTVEQARVAAADFLQRAQPMITEAENRLARIAHSLLDRFTIDITIKLNPYARASSVEQDKKREQ